MIFSQLKLSYASQLAGGNCLYPFCAHIFLYIVSLYKGALVFSEHWRDPTEPAVHSMREGYTTPSTTVH